MLSDICIRLLWLQVTEYLTKSQFIFLTRTPESGCSRVSGSGSLMSEFCVGFSAVFFVVSMVAR